MTRYRVAPNCRGLDMADGTHYNARDGYVTIDRPEHQRALAKSQINREYDQVSSAVIISGRIGGYCDACSHSLWPWQATCPRCGHPQETR